MVYVSGVDEAGRGPVIGPLVMAIAAINEDDVSLLEDLGVTDSKLLSLEKRNFLFDKIKSLCEFELEIVSPQEIDAALLDPSRNLNILEAEITGRLINKLVARLGAYKVKKVILDCPSINPQSYLVEMGRQLTLDVPLVAEHKADLKYLIVGAASILAKVTRDREIDVLKKECGYDFGSGYPSDPKTIAFIKTHFQEFDFFRKTWGTYKRVASSKKQQSLGDFGVDTSLSPLVKKKQKALSSLDGFEILETKGLAEVLRIKKPGITITLYKNGKLLFQGRDKVLWESKVKKLLS